MELEKVIGMLGYHLEGETERESGLDVDASLKAAVGPAEKPSWVTPVAPKPLVGTAHLLRPMATLSLNCPKQREKTRVVKRRLVYCDCFSPVVLDFSFVFG